MILHLKALFLLLLLLFIARLALILRVFLGQRGTSQTRLALEFSVVSTVEIDGAAVFTATDEWERLGGRGHESGRWLSCWSEETWLGRAGDGRVIWWHEGRCHAIRGTAVGDVIGVPGMLRHGATRG